MASAAFWTVALSGPLRVTVPASLSTSAFASGTVWTAFSTPVTQLLQQRWTPLILAEVSAALAMNEQASRMAREIEARFILLMLKVYCVCARYETRV